MDSVGYSETVFSSQLNDRDRINWYRKEVGEGGKGDIPSPYPLPPTFQKSNCALTLTRRPPITWAGASHVVP